MPRIQSRIDVRSPEFRHNWTVNAELAQDLRARIEKARYERPAANLARLRERGKLRVHERLNLLIDPGSPFLELSPLAACDAYDDDAPQGLVVTGIGLVKGRFVVVIAGDSSLKGGSWYPLSIKKIIRALDIAAENHLPVIHLVDSGGAFLPLQDEIYALGGHIYHKQCLLSGAGIPQIAVVLGPCTAGGAYLPTLCDQSIMVRGTGYVFLGGPPLVKAATGEEVTAEALGGADMQTSISGTADYAVDTEDEALTLCRELVDTWDRGLDPLVIGGEEPYYDPQELYGLLPVDIKRQFDMREILARLVDGSRFLEFKADYGKTMITGWASIHGRSVGVLGNNGVLFSEAANKATQFMQLCDRDRTPLLFLHNVTGFMVGEDYERGGITKNGAKMLMVQANVTVPKISLLAHASQGAGNYAMSGRAWGPRLLFAWPNSRSSIMGADQAVNTMRDVRVQALKRNQDRELTPREVTKIDSELRAHFEETSNPYHLTSELRDDGILDPVETRQALAISLAVSSHAPGVRTPSGILRI